MNSSLHSFFIRNVTSAFHDLQIGDKTVTEYLSEMLARFAQLENLYRIPAVPLQKLTTVGETLIELDHRMDISRDEFNPFSGKEISRHIGDFTLFMTGFFKEYCEYHSLRNLYLEEGPRSYQKVVEWTRLNYQPGEGLSGELSGNYENYSGALDYMKKIHLPIQSPDFFGNLAHLLE